MTGIIIITYNEAAFIIPQLEGLKKYCKDNYQAVIIDNSTITEVSENIKYHAELRGAIYYKTNSATQNGSESHCFAANLSYQLIKDKYDFLMYMDHDLFPLQPFSVQEMLGGKILGGLAQPGVKHNKTYYWPGLVMWDNNRIDRNLVDFWFSHEFELDTGGNFYKLVELYGKENCMTMGEVYYQNSMYHGAKYNHYTVIKKDAAEFMHFIGGSNWISLSDHTERINTLLAILSQRVREN